MTRLHCWFCRSFKFAIFSRAFPIMASLVLRRAWEWQLVEEPGLFEFAWALVWALVYWSEENSQVGWIPPLPLRPPAPRQPPPQ